MYMLKEKHIHPKFSLPFYFSFQLVTSSTDIFFFVCPKHFEFVTLKFSPHHTKNEKTPMLFFWWATLLLLNYRLATANIRRMNWNCLAAISWVTTIIQIACYGKNHPWVYDLLERQHSNNSILFTFSD